MADDIFGLAEEMIRRNGGGASMQEYRDHSHRHAVILARAVQDQQAKIKRLRELLQELRAVVLGECPQLLNEDSDGDAQLSMEIDAALASQIEKENKPC
ncbi:hypothetical protein LCGC14_0901860 [marine sediment metagenome]|uniref:Uncharacterized protein n=1 Tax=marine sediment metagenome TaxID=412755 RepID=A0A0F9PGX0_9ZZZZ